MIKQERLPIFQQDLITRISGSFHFLAITSKQYRNYASQTYTIVTRRLPLSNRRRILKFPTFRRIFFRTSLRIVDVERKHEKRRSERRGLSRWSNNSYSPLHHILYIPVSRDSRFCPPFWEWKFSIRRRRRKGDREVVIYIFQSTGLGPVSMLVESRACWKMFLFHRVGRRKGRRCSTFLDACGCGIYASSTISANRFTPTDRGKSVSLALPAYLLAWKYSLLPFEFPADFQSSLPLSLFLSLFQWISFTFLAN